MTSLVFTFVVVPTLMCFDVVVKTWRPPLNQATVNDAPMRIVRENPLVPTSFPCAPHLRYIDSRHELGTRASWHLGIYANTRLWLKGSWVGEDIHLEKLHKNDPEYVFVATRLFAYQKRRDTKMCCSTLIKPMEFLTMDFAYCAWTVCYYVPWNQATCAAPDVYYNRNIRNRRFNKCLYSRRNHY